MTENPFDEFIDDSQLPLFVISTPPYVSDEAVDEVCRRMTGLLDRQERVALCWDLTAMSMVTSDQRRRLMEFQRDEVRRFSQYFIAEAYVIRSIFVRGLVVAVESFARPPYPTRSFNEIATAKVWLRHLIAEDGKQSSIRTAQPFRE